MGLSKAVLFGQPHTPPLARQEKTSLIKIDQLIRSRRKTVAIEVHPDGRVIVRAPLRASRLQIEQFVAQKQDWIRRKQAEAQDIRLRQAELRPAQPQFKPGETFLFLGEAYPLAIVDQQPGPLLLDGRFYLRRDDLPRAAQVFEAWYKAQARLIFETRLAELSRLNGFQAGKLRLSSARTRWGSCSSQGTISLTWRLVMAPPTIIDYVIVHELVHLVENNHSSRFWVKVEAILPDYRARRKWLKVNGHRLVWAK